MTDQPRTLIDAVDDLHDAVRDLTAIAMEGWKYASPLLDRLNAIAERLERYGADHDQPADSIGDGRGTGTD